MEGSFGGSAAGFAGVESDDATTDSPTSAVGIIGFSTDADGTTGFSIGADAITGFSVSADGTTGFSTTTDVGAI